MTEIISFKISKLKMIQLVRILKYNNEYAIIPVGKNDESTH